jgi:hypothetical protein
LLGSLEERVIDLEVRRHVPRLFHTRVVSMDAHSPQREEAIIRVSAGAADTRTRSRDFPGAVPRWSDDDFTGLIIPGLNPARTRGE